MRRSLLIGWIACCALVLPHLGCQSAAPGDQGRSAPVPLPERAGELTPDEAAQARTLYTTKCARCHKFYNPADYNDSEWHSWMTKMNRKAHLSPPQADLISRYLETFRPLLATAPKPPA